MLHAFICVVHSCLSTATLFLPANLIPLSFPPCPQQALQQLDLSFNSFTGPLPPSWSTMSALQQLWLDVNKLSGPLPASWSGLTALQKLVSLVAVRAVTHSVLSPD